VPACSLKQALTRNCCLTETSSNNFPLRGGKNTLWEGGTRVAAAIAGAGIVKTGYTSNAKVFCSPSRLFLPLSVSFAAWL
jgi:hypothetical protein